MMKYIMAGMRLASAVRPICVMIFLYAGCVHTIDAQCPPGNVTLNTQTQVDAFAVNWPNCTQITGEVLINSQPAANITNLDGLAGIASITGSLRILNCSGLTGFTGLSNLTTIGNYLYIGGCALPKNFSGLHNLTSIGGYLQIANNRDLEDISALSKITLLPDDLRILSLQILESLQGLHNLVSVAGNVEINNNIKLNDLTALAKLTTINGYLWVTNNRVLTSLAGLQNIQPATITDLRLISNDLLLTCEISNVCTYLMGPRPRMVSDNAPGCASVAEVLNACTMVSIDHHNVQRLSAFPNPITGIVRIDGLEAAQMVITDVLGRTVGHSTLVDGHVDLTWLTPGTYHLRMRTEDGMAVARVVKE